jgi:hypothetical protein
MDVRQLSKNIHVSIRVSECWMWRVDFKGTDQGRVAKISVKHLG